MFREYYTIDHNILLVCHLGSAFKALLLTGLGPICPLAVFVSNAITTSPLYTLVSVVSPKAQFLALFSLSCNIPPHSVLLKSLNHHLYADDIQLFLSFHPSEFHSNITHLQNALQQISSWMSANLTLNSSKTEFLLIGLTATTF